MLQLDLSRLSREGRARVAADVSREDPFWHGTDLTPQSPLRVRLEAQQAGPDVVVRGAYAGEFALQCRRCLEPVVGRVDEELALLYRAGTTLGVDESEDVYPLPERGDVDLTGPVREQLLLAVPRFVACREGCQGLCVRCGANLNETTCTCTTDELDDRWAPLRRLKLEE